MVATARGYFRLPEGVGYPLFMWRLYNIVRYMLRQCDLLGL